MNWSILLSAGGCMRRIILFTIIVFLAFVLVVLTAKNAADAAEPTGCAQTQQIASILALYGLDEPVEALEMERQLGFIQTQACRGAYSENATITYRNGQTAAIFPGRVDTSWFWPNGRSITATGFTQDATVLYPNGTVLTASFLRPEATHFYANGAVLSSAPGRAGAAINLRDGASVVSPGFEADGRLNFSPLADYVRTLNQGPQTPSVFCDRTSVRSDLTQALQLIEGNSPSAAADTLRRIQNCL